MLTLEAVWPSDLEFAKQTLLDDLASIRISIPGITDPQPFPRASMEPAVDDLIKTVMEATYEAIDQKIPTIQTTVRQGATSVSKKMLLATVALSFAVGFIAAKLA